MEDRRRRSWLFIIILDILWGKKGNSPSVLRQEKCHKKISQRQAENTTDKTNVGPHVASGAIHHAASCEKIRHAMRSRKKNVFAEGNSPPSVRQLGTQAAPTKSRKNTRSKKLSFLCQKKRSKTTKNHLSFSTRCNRRVPKVCKPAFAWWAPRYLKEKRRILKKVKSRYWKRTHKYGVEVPKTVAEAYALDRKNGNNLWREAIEKEMRNNRVAFEILGEGERAPRGYSFIDCHMIFDVKMDGAFTRKARYVANGNMIDAPPSMTYASVVSRDSVRIALTLAALNDLDVQCADVQNAST